MAYRPTKAQQDRAHKIRRRTLAIIVAWAVLLAGCIVKLSYLQIFNAAGVAEEAANSRTVTARVQAMRGKIVDAHNKTLADSVEAYKIYVDQVGAKNFVPTSCTVTRTNSMTDAEYKQATDERQKSCHSLDGKDVPGKGASAVARILAPVLDLNEAELAAEIAGKSRYIVVAKSVTPQLKRKIDKLSLSGIVGSELISKRVYPNATLLGGILGGVNDEGQGVAGIESMADASLKGVDGVETYQQANPINGYAKIPGTEKVQSKAHEGGTVQLTVDRDVQWYAQSVLNERVDETNADWGIAVVQEVSTGKILAITDSNNYAANSSQAEINGSLAMTATFDPGSTGKVITAAGILQEGLHKPTDHFLVPYSYKYDNETYHDALYHPTERLTLAGILYNSYNTGTVMTAKNYSLEKRYHYITAFGLGQPTGIGFPGESQGLLTHYSKWDRRTKQTVLFGQGYTVNALQMVNVISTIANGGVRVGQRLIEKSTDSNGKDTTPAAKKSSRVISKETAGDVINMMESVAENNANNLKVKDYRVAGKSGTAEVAGQGGSLTDILADFIGAVPAENPKFVIGVFLKNPDTQYGGLSAGPVVGKITTFLMQKYQIPHSPQRKDAIPLKW